MMVHNNLHETLYNVKTLQQSLDNVDFYTNHDTLTPKKLIFAHFFNL